MMSFCSENALLFVDNDSLMEAANTMSSNVECVGVREEGPSVWIVDFLRRVTAVHQWHEDIVDDVKDLQTRYGNLGLIN